MDSAMFERMTDAEATAYLASFREAAHHMRPRLSDLLATNEVNPALESIPEVFVAVAASVETVPLPVDETLPEWITSSASYGKNLFAFTPESQELIATAADVMGESFIRRYDTLTWGVGTRNTAAQSQPVVAGFKNAMELSVLLVAENIVARAVAGDSAHDVAQQAVDAWEAKV